MIFVNSFLHFRQCFENVPHAYSIEKINANFSGLSNP